ncbi:MAG TPA: hypothetical protein PLY56_06680 [Armatimonadota bacterium]|nr:hypothetical protein [Armatimonadota bacterium]HOM81484.1 hypothetical protein [Armatimonadota bacterium]HPO74696.1 hypothetical protein [Armatimonadota bacterium]
MQLPIREAYCPGHFGNSYEAMWPREMAAYLAEIRHWGFNRFGDWMTCTDVCNPYATDAYWNLPLEMYSRKKAAFRAAQELGMANDLILTPNHVFLDQLRPDLLATKAPKIFGQLLCPSKPEARTIMLENADRQFRDLAESGVRIDSFTAFAYDYGGCACADCAPWILTWARLVRDIHAVAQRYYPEIEPWLCAWWWTEEEHVLFNDWAAREAPGWAKAIIFHIPYGRTRFADLPVPEGCRRLAFIHIGYGDVPGNGDIYAKHGAVVASQRLSATLDEIATMGAEGFQAYSEGQFDDINKALVAGLSSGQFDDASAVLRAYSARYFGASPAQAERWASWLAAWGDRAAVDLPAATQEFEALSREATPGWRLEHLRSKLTLERLDREIGPEGEWDARRLALADAFWAEQERLQRDAYRLGPVRHIFAPKFSPPKWYESWRAVSGAAAAQAMPEEA